MRRFASRPLPHDLAGSRGRTAPGLFRTPNTMFACRSVAAHARTAFGKPMPAMAHRSFGAKADAVRCDRGSACARWLRMPHSLYTFDLAACASAHGIGISKGCTQLCSHPSGAEQGGRRPCVGCGWKAVLRLPFRLLGCESRTWWAQCWTRAVVFVTHTRHRRATAIHDWSKSCKIRLLS